MPFTIKPTNQIVDDILFNIVQGVPDINDINPGSVLRTQVESVALELAALYQELNDVYEGTRIETATSTDLDNLGSLVGVERKEGTQASGNVTFIRAQPSTVDFSIPAGAIVSTQPNTGETQYRFTVDANTIFRFEITDESHEYVDGIINYKMDERFIGVVSDLTGTSGAVPYIFVEGTDFNIVRNTTELIITPGSILLVDDCETADWTESVDATADVLDNVNYIQGSNSLKLGKSGTTTNEFSYEKILGAVKDGTGKNLVLAVYIKDQFTLNKLQKMNLLIGSGGSDANSVALDIAQNRMEVGWNKYELDASLDTAVTTGTPNIAAINFLRITFYTNFITDTVVSGDINMDFWIFAETDDFTGDVIQFDRTGTLPDDTTDFFVDYNPLSKEVPCTAESVGEGFNVGRNKIIFKVSIIANIDNINNYAQMQGGTDVETDDDYRERIQLATQVQAKATVTALQQAVLAVDGVTSVGVDDLPRKTMTSEPILFATGTDDYGLEMEVAIDNATLEVSATVGAVPGTILLNGVDYILENSIIRFQALGTKPDDATIFYVTYDYDWLGHVEMFVSGIATPLPAAVVTAVDTAIAETKAAGVVVTWDEPTIVTVPVTVNILADTANGYTFAGLQPIVESAIEDFLNTIEVGTNVYIADIIQLCQDIEGVLNTTVTLPAADVVIAESEVARPGAITVLSL